MLLAANFVHDRGELPAGLRLGGRRHPVERIEIPRHRLFDLAHHLPRPPHALLAQRLLDKSPAQCVGKLVVGLIHAALPPRPHLLGPGQRLTIKIEGFLLECRGQRLHRVVREPTPLGIHGEQRDVAEHDERGVGGTTGQVLLDEVELLAPQDAQVLNPARVDQEEEVDTVQVEAVVAVPAAVLAEEAEVLLIVGVADRVVLTGDGVDLRRLECPQELLDGVELVGLGEMGEVTRVRHEGRALWQGVDLGDGVGEGPGDIGVRRPLEADVAVADLDEVEILRAARLGGRLLDPARGQQPAGDRPDGGGACPGHAFQETSPVDAVRVRCLRH